MRQHVKNVRRAWVNLLQSIRQRVPPGARWILGAVLIVAGIFGFLPILGFWMIPLGFAVVFMDLQLLGRAWRKWRHRKNKTI